jgi:hypothetical protein
MLRFTAITCQTRLDETLDTDPFLVDSRAQVELCQQWAAAHGHVVWGHTVTVGCEAEHQAWWQHLEEPNRVGFVTPNRRVFEVAVKDPETFAAECERRGMQLAFADLPEPQYTAQMKANVHRRLSMPTAGYNGC